MSGPVRGYLMVHVRNALSFIESKNLQEFVTKIYCTSEITLCLKALLFLLKYKNPCENTIVSPTHISVDLKYPVNSLSPSGNLIF